MRRLLPVVLAVLGLTGGVGAGLALRPAPEPDLAGADPGAGGGSAPAPALNAAPPAERDYLRLGSQFVVPVLRGGRVAALVVLTLSLEVAPDSREAVSALEPRLRDGFLQVLFDHANAGGFDGVFTSAESLRALRRALLETAQKAAGPAVTDVLIGDLVRQDA
jgi:hypothetical protein